MGSFLVRKQDTKRGTAIGKNIPLCYNRGGSTPKKGPRRRKEKRARGEKSKEKRLARKVSDIQTSEEGNEGVDKKGRT